MIPEKQELDKMLVPGLGLRMVSFNTVTCSLERYVTGHFLYSLHSVLLCSSSVNIFLHFIEPCVCPGNTENFCTNLAKILKGPWHHSKKQAY